MSAASKLIGFRCLIFIAKQYCKLYSCVIRNPNFSRWTRSLFSEMKLDLCAFELCPPIHRFSFILDKVIVFYRWSQYFFVLSDRLSSKSDSGSHQCQYQVTNHPKINQRLCEREKGLINYRSLLIHHEHSRNSKNVLIANPRSEVQVKKGKKESLHSSTEFE